MAIRKILRITYGCIPGSPAVNREVFFLSLMHTHFNEDEGVRHTNMKEDSRKGEYGISRKDKGWESIVSIRSGIV